MQTAQCRHAAQCSQAKPCRAGLQCEEPYGTSFTGSDYLWVNAAVQVRVMDLVRTSPSSGSSQRSRRAPCRRRAATGSCAVQPLSISYIEAEQQCVPGVRQATLKQTQRKRTRWIILRQGYEGRHWGGKRRCERARGTVDLYAGLDPVLRAHTANQASLARCRFDATYRQHCDAGTARHGTKRTLHRQCRQPAHHLRKLACSAQCGCGPSLTILL